MFKLKIKKSATEYFNLSRFLTDDTYNAIQVKQLLMIVTEFLRSHFLKSYGFSKNRLPGLVQQPQLAEEEAEYYYDEEDEQSASAQDNRKMLIQNSGPTKPAP